MFRQTFISECLVNYLTFNYLRCGQIVNSKCCIYDYDAQINPKREVWALY